MNRRQLFGWLSALPFMPAALAKPAPITFPTPTADWGKIRFVVGPWGISEVSGDGYARTPSDMTLSSWADGPSGLPYPFHGPRMPFDPAGFIDMHYKPNLPEWW